jgi:hypothetical protein
MTATYIQDENPGMNPKEGHIEVARLLLNRGADCKVKDKVSCFLR